MALDTIPKQEGGKFKAVASGALPNGKPVVVNADGTVSVVEEVAGSFGTPVVFENGDSAHFSAVYAADAQKVVIAYQDQDNSSKGTAIVGTVSGTSISFGSAVVFSAGIATNISAAYDSNVQRVVITYRDNSNSNFGTAIVGTVLAGSVITFGTAVVFESADSINMSAVYDANAQKIVIAYKDVGNSEYGTAVVGTVSGTSISFGSPVVFSSAQSKNFSAVYDSTNQKVVVAYTDQDNSSYGTAVVGTVSGTSISFGSAVVFESANTQNISAAYHVAAQKVVIAYRDATNADKGTAVVGAVSGTTISFGTPVVFESADSINISAVYDASVERVVIAYENDDDPADAGTYVVGSVNGDSISFGTPVVFESSGVRDVSAVYDPDAEKVVIAYVDTTVSRRGQAGVLTTGYFTLTAGNYIGISSGGTVPDAGNATVDIVGTINKDQSGLAAGQQYYVQTDGTLDTTADNPSVLAGTAISATKLVVKS